MITSYKKAKEDVLRLYEDALETDKRVHLLSNNKTLEDLANRAERIKEDKFCLMIAGEAKSGKSTFINAYLGREILPMDVKQCTSSVVEICYGEKFELRATYADGTPYHITEEQEIKAFLRKNAAIDEAYRDIPVTSINNEIIVKYKGNIPPEPVIQDLLKGVSSENIHRLTVGEYNRKIRKYIEYKTPRWREVAVKIEIQVPYEDKSMRGVRIVDSPGVNAAGRVGEVTENYIQSADAIMFLRPITGQAIEANSFKRFLETTSVDRNKNALFLILTRSASESEETISQACTEFEKMFGVSQRDKRRGVAKKQIIPVDSKAELYYNSFASLSTEEIKNRIREMNTQKTAEPFLKAAWFDSLDDKEQFLAELKRYSNFNAVDRALNIFGRKAHYIMLSEFLGEILKLYAKILVDLRDQISLYQEKAKNPEELSKTIKILKNEIYEIEDKMQSSVSEILEKYAGSGPGGIIAKKADEVISAYKASIEKINVSDGDDDDDVSSALDKLEKISLRQIDIFKNYEDELQKNVIAECDAALMQLSDKSKINYLSLEPNLTKSEINRIKESAESSALKEETYTSGKTFKKTHTISVFSNERYYSKVKESILERIEGIKNDAIGDLRGFVFDTIALYSRELNENAKEKTARLSSIEKEKQTAEETQKKIQSLNETLLLAESNEAKVNEIKGGIDSGLQ